MENSSLKNMQNALKKANAVINSDDTTQFIKNSYGNKYTDDISDSDVDESMSYRKKNNDVIKKLSDKNNSAIKPKLDNDTISLRSMSLKKAPLRKTIKEKIKTTENKNINDKVVEKTEDNNEDSENNDENESFESIEEYEFKDDFENQVKNYVKADDRIAELQKEIKELNQLKKTAGDSVMKHLERLGETNINITGGKLIINQYGSKGGLKEDVIKDALSEKIKDPKIVESILLKIDEKREENAKIQKGLKRTTAKKK